MNSVPLNGGDEALLRATIFLLEKTYSNTKITVLCNDLTNTKKYFPDLLIAGDLDHVFGKPFKRWSIDHFKILTRSIFFDRFDLSKLLDIPYILLTSEEKETRNIFIQADLIIASAGGYLHDFYDNNKRLEVFYLLNKIKKQVILFGQSIGPFWKSNTRTSFLNVLNAVNLILLRESISLQHLKNLGVSNPATFVTTDNAFILHEQYPQLFRYRQQPKNKIVLSFRYWKDDGAKIIQLAKSICILLLKSPMNSITFLSTCQGVANYTDDSLIAKKIISQLPTSLQKRCNIDRKKYSIPDLIEQYSQYDAYIGMRLHGAILAMLGGTPAFNIGYEDKTKGIYTFMDLQDQNIFYTEDERKIKKKINFFMENLSDINNDFLATKVKNAAAVAEKNIFYLKQYYDQA